MRRSNLPLKSSLRTFPGSCCGGPGLGGGCGVNDPGSDGECGFDGIDGLFDGPGSDSDGVYGLFDDPGSDDGAGGG